MEPSLSPGNDVLVFNLGPQHFALPVGQVSTVVPRATLTPLPGAPAELIGLLRLRGALCPVIDIRVRLGLPAGVPHIGERIVVMRTSTFGVGLLVDGIVGLVVVPMEAAIDRPAISGGDRSRPAESSTERGLVRGVVEVAGQVVATLDAEAAVGADVRVYLTATADGLHGFVGQTAA
ncbi:MAG TPA: chemotaxis protein CheW [Chloroflexota bacterium]|nr:chemotaxis protein CheW [Chloroflexota bacterium]